MRILFFLLFILFFSTSCSKFYSEYRKGNMGTAILVPDNLKISGGDILDWKVGRGFKQTISKGVQVQFHLPVLKESDLEDVMSKGIDAWIIKVIKDGSRGREVMGYIYFPFKSKSLRSRTSIFSSTTMIKKGAVNILYAAAYTSSRFRSFKCPAFGHNKVIEEFLLIDGGKPPHFLISSSEERSVRGKIEKFGLAPSTYNGGTSLIGKYGVELAFYNIKNKKKMSNFVRVPGYLSIENEGEEIIKGCTGFVVPRKEDEDRKVFKFGR